MIFYILSFTWGLPMTLIGCIAAVILRVLGYKPKRYGYCWHFEVGERWGGVNLGVVFITDKHSSVHTKNHEHGHAIQNCFFGFLMPFVVAIPSAMRYWYFTLTPNKKHAPYESVWFEAQATKLGNKIMENF